MVSRTNLSDPYTIKSNFESMSGVNTSVIFEFPIPGDEDNSYYVEMKSIVTLSYSVYRAKMPVTLMGGNTIDGFALGSKTVAGSIIKTLVYEDELSAYLTIYKDAAQLMRNKISTPNLGSRYHITQKEFESLMRDDITPFNIYSYSMSEYTGKMIMDAIYGATIINNGQVQSIENLITENTISFVAKTVDQAHSVTSTSSSIPSLTSVMTGSKLLKEKKK